MSNRRKYLVLFSNGNNEDELQENQSIESYAQELDSWNQWYDWLQNNGNLVDVGAQLSKQGSIQVSSEDEDESNGTPESESFCFLPTGYLILRARDMNQALRLVKRSPTVMAGGLAHVYQILNTRQVVEQPPISNKSNNRTQQQFRTPTFGWSEENVTSVPSSESEEEEQSDQESEQTQPEEIHSSAEDQSDYEPASQSEYEPQFQSEEYQIDPSSQEYETPLIL